MREKENARLAAEVFARRAIPERIVDMEMVAEAEKKDESIIKPGLYRDIDFDTYSEWDAVNASTLNGFSRTPAHVYYDMLHGGKERTAALDLGWLVHLVVLEPERFEAEVVVPPKMDPTVRSLLPTSDCSNRIRPRGQ